jgi:catechol 2,3-dioxygenase
MLKGVLRPGHIQIRVLDLEAAVVHYRDRLGLIEVGRDSAGRVYLKGWTEVDRFSVVLREADTAGSDFTAFKVLNTEVLNKLAGEPADWGCPVERIPGGELDGCGERVRFQAPTGHQFELYAEKVQTGKWGISPRNPDAWPEGLQGMCAQRFDHSLLYGRDIDANIRLFTEVLGFWLSEQALDGELCLAAFLSCSMKAHDIAFIRHEQDNRFHHASFHLPSWEAVLRAADIISMHDIALDIGPTRHGLTHGETIYFFDPSGNRNEVFAGGNYSYPDHTPITWTVDQLGKAIFYHQREVNARFMTVVT